MNPTIAEAKAPRPICKAPISAEALPASFLNSANESAAEFGKLNPDGLEIEISNQ